MIEREKITKENEGGLATEERLKELKEEKQQDMKDECCRRRRGEEPGKSDQDGNVNEWDQGERMIAYGVLCR